MKKIKTFESFNFDELDFINESKVWYLPSFRDKIADVAVEIPRRGKTDNANRANVLRKIIRVAYRASRHAIDVSGKR